MKKEPIQRTQEEIDALTENNRRQYTLVAAIIWVFCSVAWLVTLVLDVIHDAATLQLVLHGVCTVLTAVAAVLNFRRWRRMTATPTTSAEDALDSNNK